jgi:seryl-tRNA synthetase
MHYEIFHAAQRHGSPSHYRSHSHLEDYPASAVDDKEAGRPKDCSNEERLGDPFEVVGENPDDPENLLTKLKALRKEVRNDYENSIHTQRSAAIHDQKSASDQIETLQQQLKAQEEAVAQRDARIKELENDLLQTETSRELQECSYLWSLASRAEASFSSRCLSLRRMTIGEN